jgi:WD40 repeat protein
MAAPSASPTANPKSAPRCRSLSTMVDADPVTGSTQQPLQSPLDQLASGQALAPVGGNARFTTTGGLLTRSTQVPRDVLSRCRGAVFSPHARLLALSPGQHSLLLWDVEAGRPLHTLQPGIQTVNTCFTFSPDGKEIAMGDGINRQVIVWDVATGKLMNRHPIPLGRAEVIAFRPDGRELLAGSSQGDLFCWDVETKQQRYAARVTAGGISALAFRKDGGEVALADRERKIILADAATGRPIRTIRGHLHPVHTIVFHPDDRRVLSADGEQLHAWDSRRDQGVTAIDIEGPALSFSPDGRSLAVTGKYETREADLFEVVGAFGVIGRLAHFLHRGRKDSDEHGDDGDHDQELEQGKAAWLFHRTRDHGRDSGDRGLHQALLLGNAFSAGTSDNFSQFRRKAYPQ